MITFTWYHANVTLVSRWHGINFPRWKLHSLFKKKYTCAVLNNKETAKSHLAGPVHWLAVRVTKVICNPNRRTASMLAVRVTKVSCNPNRRTVSNMIRLIYTMSCCIFWSSSVVHFCCIYVFCLSPIFLELSSLYPIFNASVPLFRKVHSTLLPYVTSIQSLYGHCIKFKQITHTQRLDN
jgi:hypothetical protein